MKHIRKGLIIGMLLSVAPLIHAVPFYLEIMASPDDQQLTIFIDDMHKKKEAAADQALRAEVAQHRKDLLTIAQQFGPHGACIVEDMCGEATLEERLTWEADVVAGEFLLDLQRLLEQENITAYNAECRFGENIQENIACAEKQSVEIAAYEDKEWHDYYEQALGRVRHNINSLQQQLAQNPHLNSESRHAIVNEDRLPHFHYFFAGEQFTGSDGAGLWDSELLDMRAIHSMTHAFQNGKQYVVFAMGAIHNRNIRTALHSKGWKTIYTYNTAKKVVSKPGDSLAQKLKIMKTEPVISLSTGFNLFYQQYPQYNPAQWYDTWASARPVSLPPAKKKSFWCCCSAKTPSMTAIAPTDQKDEDES